MSNKDRDHFEESVERFIKKEKHKLLYGNLHGYVSPRGVEAISRLKALGFDADSAFTFAETCLRDNEFYEIEDTSDDE